MGTTQKNTHKKKDTSYLGTIQKAYKKAVAVIKPDADTTDNQPTNYSYSKPAKFFQNRRKQIKQSFKRRLKRWQKTGCV
jgi:hypothetical protein